MASSGMADFWSHVGDSIPGWEELNVDMRDDGGFDGQEELDHQLHSRRFLRLSTPPPVSPPSHDYPPPFAHTYHDGDPHHHPGYFFDPFQPHPPTRGFVGGMDDAPTMGDHSMALFDGGQVFARGRAAVLRGPPHTMHDGVWMEPPHPPAMKMPSHNPNLWLAPPPAPSPAVHRSSMLFPARQPTINSYCGRGGKFPDQPSASSSASSGDSSSSEDDDPTPQRRPLRIEAPPVIQPTGRQKGLRGQRRTRAVDRDDSNEEGEQPNRDCRRVTRAQRGRASRKGRSDDLEVEMAAPEGDQDEQQDEAAHADLAVLADVSRQLSRRPTRSRRTRREREEGAGAADDKKILLATLGQPDEAEEVGAEEEGDASGEGKGKGRGVGRGGAGAGIGIGIGCGGYLGWRPPLKIRAVHRETGKCHYFSTQREASRFLNISTRGEGGDTQ